MELYYSSFGFVYLLQQGNGPVQFFSFCIVYHVRTTNDKFFGIFYGQAILESDLFQYSCLYFW